MYCPNCGAEAANGTVYCGNCGFNIAESEGAGETALLTEQPVQFVGNQHNVQADAHSVAQQTDSENEQNSDAKKKSGVVRKLIPLFVILGIVLIGAIGLIAGSFFITPEATAKKFASKLENNDVQGMYDMIFGSDGYVTFEQFNEKYINDDAFLNWCAGKEYYEINEFDIYDAGHMKMSSEASDVDSYVIICTDAPGAATANDALYVDVVKEKDGFLYFDEYRVEVYQCVNYQLYLPDGVKVYINDTEVTDEGVFESTTLKYHYTISPLLADEDYTLKFVDSLGRSYEKRIKAFSYENHNSITIDAEDFDREIALKDTYTVEDAEEFFSYMMNEYTFNSYGVVYFETPQSLETNGIESIIVNDYRVNGNMGYDSYLDSVTDNAKIESRVSDIMTEDEYNLLPLNENGYAVYKVSEVQKRIDNLWGAGKISVAEIVDENDFITSKGYIIRESANAENGVFDYYGKIKSSSFDVATNVVTIDAYVLKCNTENNRIYDEATDLQVASAQITRGKDVDFDAIVNQLSINTRKMGTIRFTFQLSDYGVALLGAVKNPASKDAFNGQNVDVISYGRSFYMKVKANGGLNLRLEPNGQAEVIELIPDKTAVEVKGYDPAIKNWVYVCWKDYEGWVNYSYLTPAEYSAQPTGSVYWYIVDADGGLNMRNKDNIKGKVVTLIPDKSIVKVNCFNWDASWAYVTYDKYKGWVNTDYIRFDN